MQTMQFSPVDVLGALVARPVAVDPTAILDGVRAVEGGASKIALITSAGVQASGPWAEAAALAELAPVIGEAGLPEQPEGVLLDALARLMTEAGGARDEATRRRVLVLGIGDLLREATAAGATSLAGLLKDRLILAARRGTLRVRPDGIPGAS